MANVDSAFGFKPLNRDGSPYNGATLRCVFAAADATAAFVGDPVILDGSSDTGYPGVSQCAAGEPVFGVVTGFEANPDALSDQYRKASTKRFCQVALANQALFVVQDEGNIGLAGVGLNAAFVKVAGSTVTGFSKSEIGTATVATGGDVMIMGGYDAADNDLTASNALWVIKFNDPETKNNRLGI